MAKARVAKSSAKLGIDLPECPVCMETMCSPIFQCQSGHSLCRLCTENLIPPNCPMCRQPMTQMRNWQLEELVDKAKKSCPNKDSGCIYTVMASKMQDHLKECIFREMKCPHGIVFGRCSWSGKVNQMLDHFKDKHPENSYITLDNNVDIDNISTKNDERFMFLLSQGKFIFLFTIKIDTCQKMVYYVVQNIGNKQTYAQQFVYEVQITSKQDNRRKVMFTDHCFSDGYEINKIFSEGKCGVMPLTMLSQFLKSNSVTLKITITRTAPLFKNKPTNKNKPEAKVSNVPNKQNFRSKSPGPNMRPKELKPMNKRN